MIHFMKIYTPNRSHYHYLVSTTEQVDIVNLLYENLYALNPSNSAQEVAYQNRGKK